MLRTLKFRARRANSLGAHPRRGLMGALLFWGAMGCTEPLPHLASPRVDGGLGSWACGFPEAAVNAGVERATVVLRALVQRNGSASDVEILAATSPLFAEHTRQCALAHYYEPARDVEGRRIEGWTAPFKLRFVPSTER